MKTSSKSLDKCQVKVSVTLDADEMRFIKVKISLHLLLNLANG